MSSDGEDVAVELASPNSLAVIAKPLADSKGHKRIYKLVKKAAKEKLLKRGVKETVKSIKKGSKGVVFLAGDISPIDVLSHIPVLCEESSIPYIYVCSKAALGTSGLSRRPTCCVMVPTPKQDSACFKYFDKCVKEMKKTL